MIGIYLTLTALAAVVGLYSVLIFRRTKQVLMANGWPNPSSGVGIKAGASYGSIKWGTEGMTTACVVVDCSSADENERLYIEQGSGLKAIRIMLLHGRNWNITIIDRSTLTPPQIGDSVLMTNILGDGTLYTVQATVVDNNVQTARKQEAHRIIQVERMTLIDVTAATAHANYPNPSF